jgi:Protein of unknown function (DUF1559)
MRRISTAFAVLIACVPPARSSAEDAMPAALTPYVDAQTVVIARVDLGRIDLDAAFKRLVAITGDEQVVAVPKKLAAAAVSDLRAAKVGIVYGLVSMSDITGDPTCLVLPLAADAEANTVMETLRKIEGLKNLTIEAQGGAVIAASRAAMARLKSIRPAARPDLAAALAAGKDAAFQIVFAPNADLCRVVEETMTNLPPAVGGGSVQIFSRGLTWACVTLATTPKFDVSLIVQASDAAVAKKMDDLTKAFVSNVVKELHNEGEQQTILAALAKLVSPVVEGDRLIVRIDEQRFNKAVPDVSARVRAAAGRMKSTNNLKQLAIAMHMYLDGNNGRFPADVVDKNGKPLLSWRVRLLPYLEQDQLHKQFKLDEPWDSEHNKKLIAKIPNVLVSPAQKSPAGTTTYLGPLGDGYLFRPNATGEGLKINDIQDGTSNTIMFVEAADGAAIEWTRPGDWTPDAKEPTKGLIGHYPDGFVAAFCDGSVRFIKKTINAKTLLALLTTAGGETIGDIP